MLIDWFTVVAQIINFLILVLMLRHFLYGPIVRAMDARGARIKAETVAATELSTAAQAEIETYRQKQLELEAQRAAVLETAKAAAETERKVLLQSARDEAAQQRERWRQGIVQETEDFLVDLQRRAGQEVIEIARQGLADLANADLEAQIAAVFADQLTALPSATWRMLLDSEPLTIVSAQPLQPVARQRLAAVVETAGGGANRLTFATEPALIGGLELRSQTHKINWNLADYLEQLREGFAIALDGEQRVTG